MNYMYESIKTSWITTVHDCVPDAEQTIQIKDLRRQLEDVSDGCNEVFREIHGTNDSGL